MKLLNSIKKNSNWMYKSCVGLWEQDIQLQCLVCFHCIGPLAYSVSMLRCPWKYAVLIFVKNIVIWVFKFHQDLSFHDSSQFKLLRLITIWIFWVSSQFEFYHNSSFHVLSQVELLSFSQFEFLSFNTFWVFEFHYNSSFFLVLSDFFL